MLDQNISDMSFFLKQLDILWVVVNCILKSDYFAKEDDAFDTGKSFGRIFEVEFPDF